MDDRVDGVIRGDIVICQCFEALCLAEVFGASHQDVTVRRPRRQVTDDAVASLFDLDGAWDMGAYFIPEFEEMPGVALRGLPRLTPIVRGAEQRRYLGPL